MIERWGGVLGMGVERIENEGGGRVGESKRRVASGVCPRKKVLICG